MSNASTKMWNGHIQFDGYTTNAYMSITFNCMYALSSIFVQLNSVRCTAACKSVTKSARERSIRLCQQICPRKQLRAFAFFVIGASMMAWIFPGSIAMPSRLTMCLRRALLVMPNAHFAGLSLTHAEWHHSKQNWRCRKYSSYTPSIVKSLRKTCMKADMYSLKLFVMVR